MVLVVLGVLIVPGGVGLLGAWAITATGSMADHSGTWWAGRVILTGVLHNVPWLPWGTLSAWDVKPLLIRWVNHR